MDYGCGKGELVKLLQKKYPFIKVCGYDPAVEEFENLPNEKFDFIIVTDVLEHIPENELPDTIAKISALSDKVFFHLHHAKAINVLPNGENAHCTIYSPEQYFELFSKFFSYIDFFPGWGAVNSSCVTFEIPKNLVEEWQFLLHPNEMQYIESLDGLIELIRDFYEVIIFYADNAKNQCRLFLDYLKYTGYISKISCITVKKVAFDRVQNFLNEIPIIPLENLRHFRKTALFIVVSDEKDFGLVNIQLKLFGCSKVIFATSDVYVQAQNKLEEMIRSGQIIVWHLRTLDEKMNSLALRVDEQNEVQTANTAAFAEYRNAFRGKKIVIVGSGPTAKYYEPIPDAIHIALNQSWKLENITFDYLFTYDVVSDDKKKEFPVSEGFDKIREKIFIGRYVERHPILVVNYPDDIIFKLKDKGIFYYMGAVNSDQHIYRDICSHPLFVYGTVSFQALHFALFTSPAEIYLVGCDTTTNDGYFYDDSQVKTQDLSVRYVKVGFARMKMFARQYYPETKIISINPVGLRGLFQDEYTGSYQKNLREQMTNW